MGQGAEPWVPWAGRSFRLGEAVKGVDLGSVRFGLGAFGFWSSREPCDFPGAVFCPKTAGTRREGDELPRLRCCQPAAGTPVPEEARTEGRVFKCEREGGMKAQPSLRTC